MRGSLRQALKGLVLGAALAAPAHAQVRLEEGQQAPAPSATAPETVPKAVPEPPATIVRPRPLDVRLEYPEGEVGRHTVILDLLVGVEGSVSEVEVMSGAGRFAEAALRAAPSWRFEPGRRNGVPTAARVRFAVAFTADARDPAATEPTQPAEPGAAPPPRRPQLGRSR